VKIPHSSSESYLLLPLLTSTFARLLLPLIRNDMANDLAVTLYHRKAHYDDLHGDFHGFDTSNDIGLHKFSTTIQPHHNDRWQADCLYYTHPCRKSIDPSFIEDLNPRISFTSLQTNPRFNNFNKNNKSTKCLQYSS